MARITPPKPRARVFDAVNAATGRQELRVVMPAPRNWFLTAFCCVWLVGWLVGIVAVSTHLTMGGAVFKSDAPGFPYAVWLMGWIFGGCWILVSWLWVTFGQEETRIAGDDFVLERRVFRLRWTRIFDRATVQFLRVTPTPAPPWWLQSNRNHMANPFQNTGCLTFDYGSKTVRFGSGIDEAEAFGIMDKLNAVLER